MLLAFPLRRMLGKPEVIIRVDIAVSLMFTITKMFKKPVNISRILGA